MNTGIRLTPGRSYTLAEVAELMAGSVVALQARLRRAARRKNSQIVELTPWILAYRFCDGREWRFSARERGGPSDDEGD
jgi:hypothetical protein